MADDTHGGSEKQLPHRTPRQTALERNDPKNFDEGPAYDITHGHPITKDMPTQEYKPLALKQPGEAKPLDIPAPFTIKGA